MYLPLSGYIQKDSEGERMSINSIGPKSDVYTIKPPEKKVDVHQENEKLGSPDTNRPKQQKSPSDDASASEDIGACAPSMSTQDFLVLKAQTKDAPYEILDRVIAKMKENVEDAGDAIETLAKLAKKTSKDNLGLQIIEKTLEAVEDLKNPQ